MREVKNMTHEACSGLSPWPNNEVAKLATQLLRLRVEGEGDSPEAQSLEKELDIKPTEETQSAE